jgi:hypothetical protein
MDHLTQLVPDRDESMLDHTFDDRKGDGRNKLYLACGKTLLRMQSAA